MVLTTQVRKLTPRRRADNRNPAGAGRATWRAGAVVILSSALATALLACAPPPPASTQIQQLEVETSGPYPNLSTVPKEAPPVTPADQRQTLLDQLQADHAAAKFLPPPSGTAVPPSQPSN